MKFIQRLKNKYNDFEYIAVIEKQQREAIHYHVLFFNLPYINKSKFAKIWGKRFVKINKVKRNKNISNYLIKYLSKDIENGRNKKQKRYLTSSGIKTPKEKVNIDIQNEILVNEINVKRTIEFENEYVGKSTYYSWK